MAEDTRGSSTATRQGQDNATGARGTQNRLQFVEDRWTDLKNAYIVYHQACWQALLFYANQSWIDWDDARKVWYPLTPSDDWVPRPRINRFSPTVDAVASNVYKVPEVECIPQPLDDPQSNMIADIGNVLADYALKKEGLIRPKDDQDDKAGHASQLFVMLGTFFPIIEVQKKVLGQKARTSLQKLGSYWCGSCDEYHVVPAGQSVPKFCPECGNPVEPDEQESMVQDMDEDGQPAMDEQAEYDLSVYIGNPLWAFPRAGARSLEDKCPFLIWAERHTLDEIYFKFDKFEAEADAEWPDGYSVTYEHALDFWYTGYSSSTMQVKDSCMVKRMYAPPNRLKDFPEGFYEVVINGKEAHTEDWDFPCHPVTMIKYLHLPNIFFARSVGFDMVELQRELNAYESVIKLHSMVSAVDPVVVDADTIVSEITGRSDKVIKWRGLKPGAEPPHRMGSGHLDDGIYKQRDNLHAEFQNVSMAVNAFRGQQEGAVTAASAISQLRGQAELMFSKPVANWNNGWCEVIRKYVKFIQYYFSLEQLAAIVGPGKEQEIQAFKRADLDKVTDWVPSAHGLPRTRDERRQEMMTLFDKGALNIQDPDVRKEVYELFGHTGMMKTFNKHATNARLENQAIKMGAGWVTQATIPGPDGQPAVVPIPGPTGQIVPAIKPMPLIEDMDTHLHFHIDQAISPDFKKWPPPAQMALIAHIEDTTQKNNIKKLQMATIAAAAQGGGKGLIAGGPKPKGQLGPGGGSPNQQPGNEASQQAGEEGRNAPEGG